MTKRNAIQKNGNGKSYFQEVVFKIIEEVSGKLYVVAVPQQMIHFLDDPEIALFLCQLMWWAGQTTNPGRYVYKSDREWGEELGLTKYTVKKAREHLEGLGVIETKLKRANGHATTHYKVNLEGFKTAFRNYIQKKALQNDVVKKREPGKLTEPEPPELEPDDFPDDDYKYPPDCDPDQLVSFKQYIRDYAHDDETLEVVRCLLVTKTRKDHPELTIAEWAKQEKELWMCSGARNNFTIDGYYILDGMFLLYVDTDYNDPDAYTIQHFNRPEVKYPLYQKVIEELSQEQNKEITEDTNVSE